jgi:repressor LexA
MSSHITKRQSQTLKTIKRLKNTLGKFPSIRDIATAMKIKSPNGVYKHLQALVEKGYLEYKDKSYSLKEESQEFIEIPILGYANAGQPLVEATEENLGSIKIKKNLKDTQLFAVIINGNSMNNAKVNGKKIEDNMYAIIQKESNYSDGDIILAIVDNSATIKKIKRIQDQVILYPDSTNDKYREIFIDDPDNDLYVNGTVVNVLPKIV